MKILHIINGLEDGGAEASLYRLCSREKNNQHVVISLMTEGKYGVLLRQLGIPVYSVGMDRKSFSTKGLFRLWQLVRQQKPDALQTWMYHSDLLGSLCGVLCRVKKIFWGIHHSSLEIGAVQSRTLKIARLSAFLSQIIPTKTICCSQAGALAHKNIGYNKDKMVVIPNGYDLEHFSPKSSSRESLREELGLIESNFLIGMVARYDPLKDHDNLLLALGELRKKSPSFNCILVGYDVNSKNQELVQKISDLGLDKQIKLLDQRSDIPEIMNACDLHVLASGTEAFPNVLAEAMACGTPCVSTDVGDAQLILGNHGWIVPKKDPIELAKALHSAISEWHDDALWIKRQESCRSHIINNFSVDRMAKSYASVWAS